MIIVNFATKEYKAGQQRLMASINGRAQTLMFNNYEVIGSPTHQESPYAFKIYAIEKAFELDPIVLWCDASLWRVGDLSVIENIIQTDGYMMEEAGAYVDQWTNSHTKAYFKFKPHEVGFTMFSAGFLGLNKNSEIAMLFFNEWKKAERAGCFRGDWSNHRHDMSAASIIAQRLNMKYQRGGTHLSYIGPGYGPPSPTSIFFLQGL